jgi:NAD(P)-dependent dehydrogenase (short-subunit alcohol dehydrogenase family)
MSYPKTVLITGASRGIGAEVARLFAKHGFNVVVNYHSKLSRAQDVATQIEALGAQTLLAQADITNAAETQIMFDKTKQTFSSLSVLILNASGGLEKNKPDDYAMELNYKAQVRLLEQALPMMPSGSCMVFVTSHLAHFYGQKPVFEYYEPVAASKKAGEDALREHLPELSKKGIRLVVVSGDLIEGTITPKLMERNSRGLIETRRSEAGVLPTIEEFAKAIVDAALDTKLATGSTIFVGSTQ